MKILLAIDGSKYSEAAVDEIACRTLPANSEVRIISVFEMPTFPIVVPWSGVDLDEVQKAAHEEMQKVIEKAAEKIRAGEEKHKLNITTKILFGSPKKAILEEAETFSADLIVVGSHGHGAIERFLLGSVSQAVALHAKCSVEIVRGAQTLAKES